MTVDLTPFARRFIVPAHGEVLVTVKPDAPRVRQGDRVGLSSLTAADLMVKQVVARDVQGTTLLLASVVVPIRMAPRREQLQAQRDLAS